MKKTGKQHLLTGLAFLIAFSLFTWLVQTVDVRPLGVNGTDIGFASFNLSFHNFCGVHMALYTITDWAGLVPILVVFAFGTLGAAQLLKRRSLWKVDADILLLGVHYLAVATLYAAFEQLPINFRPILIHGGMEVSYPSSTTLLVLGVMPTLVEQLDRRCRSLQVKAAVKLAIIVFSGFMVIGRLVSGVHWFTDIIGSCLISMGLYFCYKGLVMLLHRKIRQEGLPWNLAKNSSN